MRLGEDPEVRVDAADVFQQGRDLLPTRGLRPFDVPGRDANGQVKWFKGKTERRKPRTLARTSFRTSHVILPNETLGTFA